MSQRHRGLRQQISALLGVDQITQEFIPPILQPLTERHATHLANLIAHATNHHEECRIVYSYLPALMFRVFGYEAGQGWLETCSELPSRDREAIVALVLPDGPIHKFCIRHTRKRSDKDKDKDKEDSAEDMRFEFPRSNLPNATNLVLGGGGGSVDVASRSPVSYLAPLLAPSLRNPKDPNVLLSPLDYFYICMIASPTRKWVLPRGSNSSSKVPKRSRSIPSIRAQYNQVIAAYASKLKASSRVDTDSVFIPACLDFLYIPWAMADPDNLPRISTATADAIASLLVTLAPEKPEDLDLDSDPGDVDAGIHTDLKLSSNSAALYQCTGKMLEGVVNHIDETIPLFPLIAYIRALAIYMAPWRGSVHTALKAMLFPKPKPPSANNTSRSPSMSALSSTLSSINAHLPSPSGSPTNVSATKEAQWRSDLRRRQQRMDKELLRRTVILAANFRLANSSDGCRVLTTLGEAAHAARVSQVSFMSATSEDIEEMQLCLSALREHKLQLERRSPRKEKNFVSLLANGLGVQIERGSMLSGFTDMVHAGSTNGVAGVVSMVSSARLGTPTSLSKRRQQEKRTSALCGLKVDEVPFLGSVWDRPIAHGENETLVLMAYWLALRLEPALGYVPDTRFLGQYWVWVMISIICASCVGIRKLYFSFDT